MTQNATLYANKSLIELDERTAVCVVPGCGGAVVRHSIGISQAVDRCVRCFRRYRVSSAAQAAQPSPSKLRRFLDDFVSWRE